MSREEWLSARKELLADEKAMTRARDELNVKRRMLPMVRIEKDYVFHGAGRRGRAWLDLFDGRRQLIVRHFMFGPAWETGCPSCSAGADELSDGLLRHLHARETSLVVVAGRRSRSSSGTGPSRDGRSRSTRPTAATSTTTST